MDDVKTQLNDALKEAMKNKDNLRRDVIRFALSAMKQEEVDKRKTLTPEDSLTILQREIKKRRDTIDEAQKAGRTEIVTKEKEELAILETFLPQQLSHDEIAAFAREIIAQTGASSVKDMGKVMGQLMPKVKGKADGTLVNQVVRELLGS